jgi:hypothetical protein
MNPRDLPHHAPHPNHFPRSAHRDTCIALVDAHFLAWLQGRDDDAAHHGLARREALLHQMLGSLGEAGVHAEMLRIYWYSTQRDAAAVNGQIVRPVLPESADDGRSLVLALARDLTLLAEHRACAHVLLVADDDRLLAAVDAAQLRGLQVHMLVDDKAVDPDALERSDAAWAALLRQADRRVPLRGGPPPRREVTLMEPNDILEVVREWWADVPDADREDLKEMLPRHRGLPQEADRQLLLRLSQRLGRALELPERKVMRESARRLLEGLPLEEAPAPEA